MPDMRTWFRRTGVGDTVKLKLTSPIRTRRTIEGSLGLGAGKETPMVRTTNRWTVVAVALGMMLAVAIPAGAASWTQKVTGGGWASAGGADFSLTMSAADIKGEVKGQWQYSRTDGVTNIAHGTIDCIYVAEGESYAVMSGPVTHVSQSSLFVVGDTWSIAVLEGGNGSGDRVRIWRDDHCGAYAGSYPGIYYDGNINIRTK